MVSFGSWSLWLVFLVTGKQQEIQAAAASLPFLFCSYLSLSSTDIWFDPVVFCRGWGFLLIGAVILPFLPNWFSVSTQIGMLDATILETLMLDAMVRNMAWQRTSLERACLYRRHILRQWQRRQVSSLRTSPSKMSSRRNAGVLARIVGFCAKLSSASALLSTVDISATEWIWLWLRFIFEPLWCWQSACLRWLHLPNLQLLTWCLFCQLGVQQDPGFPHGVQRARWWNKGLSLQVMSQVLSLWWVMIHHSVML